MAKPEMMEVTYVFSYQKIHALEMIWRGDYEVVARTDGAKCITVRGAEEPAGHNWEVVALRKGKLMIGRIFSSGDPRQLQIGNGTLTVMVPPEMVGTFEVNLVDL